MRKERELYRHNFYDPLNIDLRGLWIDDEIMPGFSLHQFRVMNISGSGMNFQSDLNFPVGQKVHVQFAIKLEVEHLLKGQVIRRAKISDGNYSYAVQFNIATGDQIKLIRSINLLQLNRNIFKKDS
jgi:hypothetical protein